MVRSITLASVLVILTAAVLPAGAVTGQRDLRYPRSLAAIGDSWTGPYVASDSWATGTNRTVDSQYLRILARNPSIRRHAYNLAEAHAATGPDMSDLAFQAAAAITRHVDYIEIALGENDACRGTPLSLFTREYKAGLTHLTRALPNAHVFVLSIENVANQWRAINADPAGHKTLAYGSTLDCSLDKSATPSQLTTVAKKIAAYNDILRRICVATRHCRYDNGAVYRMRFTASDFDPIQLQELSPTGQRALSAVAWRAGYHFTPPLAAAAGTQAPRVQRPFPNTRPDDHRRRPAALGCASVRQCHPSRSGFCKCRAFRGATNLNRVVGIGAWRVQCRRRCSV